MPEGPSIALKQVSKRFADGPLILDNVSLSAQPGEIIAIVGPSGCGKSTLLRIIAGLIQPASGEIVSSREDAETAFIFQDPNLLPWATVIDNVALPLRLRGIDGESRKAVAMEWIRRVGLQSATGYYPRQLSGGMRMRASIARALATGPGILLLDEPFGALDAITRNSLNEELLRLHGETRWTAFFVTHSVTEAVFLSHRVVIMGTDPGRVTAVLDNPLPFPRSAHTRESLEFQQRVAEATARLHEALAAKPETSHP
jgi:NitT/TauT family transport system ATP-binding protein